jgi:hypothetical protein
MPKPGKRQKIALNELLKRKRKARMLATVEVIADNTKLVKVTPWVSGSGCLCQFALELPKDCIASVELTGEEHACCSKVFDIVELEFKKSASVGIESVFSQIMKAAQEHGHHLHFSHGATSTADVAPYANGRMILTERGMPCGVGTSCPPGTNCMNCDGTLRCLLPGQFCCRSGFCGQGTRCAICSGGNAYCLKPGQHCAP